MIRPQVAELVKLGVFPASHDVVHAQIEKQQQLLESIQPPLSDDEARELVKVFGPDDYYGLGWTVLHLIESAPGWPLWDCLRDTSKEWIQTLRQRLENAGITSPVG